MAASQRPRRSDRPRAELLGSLYDSIREGIYIGTLDPGDGTTLGVNPHLKLMFGFAPEEPDDAVRPFAVDRFVDPRARDALIAQLRRDGAVSDYLLRLRRADDSSIWVEVTATLHPAENGAGSHIEALVRDVSERRKLEDQGRDLSQQVTANLVGAPDTVIEKIAHLKSIGVDHCCALMIPADSIDEMNEQIEWFAVDVMAKV